VSDQTRNAPPWVTWLLIAVGVLCVIAAAVYLTKPASQLPSFFPGHDAAVHGKHFKHGLAMIGLAVVCGAAAWFTTGARKG
jgi:hypothetical protein